MIEESASIGRKLLLGSVLRVCNLIAAAIASLLLMPFIVRHLGDRVYGFWSLAAALIGYYDLLDFGISSAVSQYLSLAIGSRNHDECRSVFNVALRIQSLLGGIALLLTAVIAAATPWFCHNPADAHLFWRVIVVLGINAAIAFPARVYGGVLAAELRFDTQAWLSILGLALRTGLVVWVILSGGGLLALAWVTLAATLPVTGLQVWFARREALWARIESRSMEVQRAKSLFSYSIYTFLAFLADILRFQVDILIISGLIGLEAVTHYRVAGVFAQYYLQILIVSVGMLQPILSRFYGAGDHAALERLFFFGTKISSCISVFICLALIGWGKPFISRWMGPRYEDAYLPLVLLSLAVFLDVSQKPSIDLLYATFKHKLYTYTNWGEGILNLALSLLLARPLGIVGVAMGTLLGALVIRVLVQPWYVCKVSGFDYADYMRFFGKNLLYCGLLMGTAVGISAWGLHPNYLSLTSSAVCATVIYAIGCWRLVFNSSECERFRAAITKRIGNEADLEAKVATV